MSTSSNQTPRILTRGEESEFQVSFFADANQTTPMVPIDPAHPAYTIYDTHGTPIQTGVGVPGFKSGQYKAAFQVPKDAHLSFWDQAPQKYDDKNQGMALTADGGRYRIEWLMVTNANQQVNFVEEFDVRDIAVTQSLDRQLQYLVLAKDAVRLTFRTAAKPYQVNVRMIVRGNDDCIVAQGQYVSDLSVECNPMNNTSDLKCIKDGDSYVLVFDIPQGVTMPNTCYTALWQIQESKFDIPKTEWQIITSISTMMLPLFTHLRMLIDKFQKRLGRLQAYEDSDLLEYIAEGVRLVNLSYPTTGYQVSSMPDDLQALVMLAAGWYGLKAQAILAAELNINFSGQSVTLGVDSAGQLDSAASAMMDMFNQKIGPAKMAYVRKAGGMGTVAGRGYSYRNMYNYVYKVSSGSNTGMLLQTLTKIGLL